MTHLIAGVALSVHLFRLVHLSLQLCPVCRIYRVDITALVLCLEMNVASLRDIDDVSRTSGNDSAVDLDLKGSLKNDIALANEKMDNQFRENVVFTLADHIDFSVQRYRKNINIKLPLFYEVRQLYPKESEIGKQALNILKKRLDIALPREEAAAIALHFVNYKAQAETTPDIDYGSIIEQATGIIEQELQVTVDRDSFNYYRFVTHMHYMMKRTLDDAMIDTQNRDIFESMKKEYPSIYSCSVKVAALIEQQLKKSLSEEEILYLILHINRLCAREDCDR